MKDKKISVAVLLGGASAEKEISLESGRNVVYKLVPQKYNVIPIFVDDDEQLYKISQKLLVSSSTKEIKQQLSEDMRIRWDDLPPLVDFVFIGLHGGNGENGCVQGILEMLGVPYNGSSVLTSALCMDKFKTTNYLRSQGFDVPRAILMNNTEWFDNKSSSLQKITEQFEFPMILKPHDDGCSVLVSKITTMNELEQKLDELLRAREYALIEEYIIGLELTVGVLGNNEIRALPPSQVVVAKDILSIEEKFLPGAGENQTPAQLPANAILLVQRTIENVFRIADCKGYARIDCFYQAADKSPTKKERVIVLEINTLPGLTPATCIFHQAAEIGMKPMEFIDVIIQLGFEEHGTEKIKVDIQLAKILNFNNTNHTNTQELL